MFEFSDFKITVPREMRLAHECTDKLIKVEVTLWQAMKVQGECC